MNNKVLIVPNPIGEFIQDFSKFTEPDNFVGDMNCPECHCPIRFPIVVSNNNYYMFKKLLEITEEVMVEMGVTEKLLKEVLEKVKLQMYKNKH